jgi:DnaJ-class molecular chaperone
MGDDEKDATRGPEPDASDWMTCPTCDGTGQAGGRPCVMCAGSGKMSPDVAEDPDADDTKELEIQPGDDG